MNYVHMSRRGLCLGLVAMTLLLAACNMPEPGVSEENGGGAVTGGIQTYSAEQALQQTPGAAEGETAAQPEGEPAGETSGEATEGTNVMMLPVIASGGGAPATVTAPEAAPSSVLQLALPDGRTVQMTAADLAALPQVQGSLGGQTLQGVRLIDVLNALGVQAYSRIIFTTANGEIALAREQVTDQVVVLLAGTNVTIADAAQAQEQWIYNVNMGKIE